MSQKKVNLEILKDNRRFLLDLRKDLADLKIGQVEKDKIDNLITLAEIQCAILIDIYRGYYEKKVN